MNAKLSVKDILLLLTLTFGAVAAGFVNGLLGTGGGIILTYLYTLLIRGDGITSKDRFVSAMMTIIPISLISLSTYSSEPLKDVSLLISLMIPSALGGITGAVVSNKVKPVLLEKLFAAIVIFAGVKMILR